MPPHKTLSVKALRLCQLPRKGELFSIYRLVAMKLPLRGSWRAAPERVQPAKNKSIRNEIR